MDAPKGSGSYFRPKTRIQQTHSQHLRTRTQSSTKALTATGWGKQKETLMATYKAVMRPALEYAYYIWSPLASSTSINKLQVMQNAVLRIATGFTQDKTYNICMTKHSHFPYTSTYSCMSHNTNRKHNIPYTNIQHISTLQG